MYDRARERCCVLRQSRASRLKTAAHTRLGDEIDWLTDFRVVLYHVRSVIGLRLQPADQPLPSPPVLILEPKSIIRAAGVVDNDAPLNAANAGPQGTSCQRH